MKERNYNWIYLISLVLGVILLVLANRANLFNGIIIAVGICFMVPSVISAISYLVQRSKHEEVQAGMSAMVWITTIGGLIFGIILVCMPEFFADYLVYTFGFLLIICGIAQIMVVSGLHAAFKVSLVYVIVPIIILAGGIAVMIIGSRMLSQVVSIITGITLICFSVNGFFSTLSGHRKRKRLAPAEAEEEKHDEQ